MKTDIQTAINIAIDISADFSFNDSEDMSKLITKLEVHLFQMRVIELEQSIKEDQREIADTKLWLSKKT